MQQQVALMDFRVGKRNPIKDELYNFFMHKIRKVDILLLDMEASLKKNEEDVLTNRVKLKQVYLYLIQNPDLAM
jgi:hypothetical protein